jgi:hypothetical protein
VVHSHDCVHRDEGHLAFVLNIKSIVHSSVVLAPPGKTSFFYTPRFAYSPPFQFALPVRVEEILFAARLHSKSNDIEGGHGHAPVLLPVLTASVSLPPSHDHRGLRARLVPGYRTPARA